ncbi:unnamed protein product [Durusdinium trenchii]|uniref:Uncharacterized protein n=1 Tax=Durusdinium trenchii TaxID=1381693 RepID=A0ABP0NJ22_9DINO
MELANGCRPHPTLALAFQRMETPVSCFPLFTFATKTANAAHAAHRRWRKMSKGTSLNWPANFPELPNGRQRLPSLGLGPWATAGTEAICDQANSAMVVGLD